MSRFNGSAAASIVLVTLSFLNSPAYPVSTTPSSAAAAPLSLGRALFFISKSGTITVGLEMAATETCASESSI